MNCDILRIVRGNDFTTRMTITAIDAAGNVIENFSLEDSTEVVVKYTLAGSSHTIEAYDYDIEGNNITIQWSDLSLGKYGFEIEGKFNGYSWRSAARFIFQIVADNASANIPDGVLVDGVYHLNDWLRLLSGTGGGIKQVQADWTETDTKSPAYIQNKPNLNEKQDVLVSGENIKTINNESILGSGNITIEGGGGDVESVNGKTGVVVLDADDVGAASAAQGAKADTALQPSDVDSAMSDTSENPVQNKVVKEAIDDKLSEVTINAIPAGSIAIINNLITGGETNALSAEMGKIIKQNVQIILNALGEYAFPNGKPEISWSGEMPYDAEIEYLESNGTQYIDTLLYGNENTEVQIDFIATSINAPVGFSRGDNTNGINIYVAVGSSRFGNRTVDYSFASNTRYNVIFKDGHFIVNDVDKIFTASSPFTTPTTLTIFKTNNYFSGKVYSAKIIQNGSVVMDLIPVRIGQVGYMYDKINNKFLGNEGTGDFVLGNDVQL